MSEKKGGGENFKKELLALREAIGVKIRHRRLHIGLDTKVLAFKVGLSQGSISNIEKGKQAITAERLWQFCIALSCSPVELLPPIPDELKEFDKNSAPYYASKSNFSIKPLLVYSYAWNPYKL